MGARVAREFFVNQLVTIEVGGEGGASRLNACVGNVSDTRVWLFLFVTAENFKGIAVGQKIRIVCTDREGLYWALAEVLEVNTEPSWRVAITASIEMMHVQRRRFFRVPARVPVRFKITSSADAELVGPAAHLCLSEDLSGGGVRAQCPLQLQVGDKLELALELVPREPPGPSQLVRTEGLVKRVDPPRGALAQRLGIEFTSIDEAQRDIVIRYLFQLQRALASR